MANEFEKEMDMNYKNEFKEILNDWENYLKSLNIKMQNLLKSLLNEIIENNRVYAMCFEYEWGILNTKFEAFDDRENVITAKYDLLLDEINSKTFFPKELFDKECKMEFEKRGDNEFSNAYDDFDQDKNGIFEEWFQTCWNAIKTEYPNIPKAYFSIHDTNYVTDLSTEDEIEVDSIWNRD